MSVCVRCRVDTRETTASFPGTSSPTSRPPPCLCPPASQPARPATHSGRTSAARGNKKERQAAAPGFCSLTRLPRPLALAPPRSRRRRVSTAMPQDPPRKIACKNNNVGIRFFICPCSILWGPLCRAAGWRSTTTLASPRVVYLILPRGLLQRPTDVAG